MRRLEAMSSCNNVDGHLLLPLLHFILSFAKLKQFRHNVNRWNFPKDGNDFMIPIQHHSPGDEEWVEPKVLKANPTQRQTHLKYIRFRQC